MIEPTLDDYARRLERLLDAELAESGRQHVALMAQATKSGAINGSGFQLLERDLAEKRFVAAMEAALGECRQVEGRFDPPALIARTRELVAAHLEKLIPQMVSLTSTAFHRNAEAVNAQRLKIVADRLTPLLGEVFYEFERGLYLLPGDATAPVVINIANVHGSDGATIQQAGERASQRRGDQ